MVVHVVMFRPFRIFFHLGHSIKQDLNMGSTEEFNSLAAYGYEGAEEE